MSDSRHNHDEHAIDRVISLAEAALEACDEQGFAFAAIDISLALDKLRSIRRAGSLH